MTREDVEKLIQEAQDAGVNIHDYIAEKLWGEVTPLTHKQAKELTFPILYGASGPVTSAEAAKDFQDAALRKFTEAYPALFDHQRRIIDECSVVKGRFGLMLGDALCGKAALREHIIDVHSDECELHRYTVLAATEVDARVLAFALDGGFGVKQSEIERGHIELALTWTSVVHDA